jgi:hypothetical protein
MVLVVRRLGSRPAAPLLDFHEIAQSIETDARAARTAWSYVYMQGPVAASPMLGVHAKPGPAQEKLPPDRTRGSSGSMISFTGLAVARTTKGPVGVGIQTLTLTVRHVEADTHHHIGNDTMPR